MVRVGSDGLAGAAGRRGAARVLDALDVEQRAAATAVEGPVCVIAGAGTGKTRMVTHRIANAVRAGGVDPCEVLVVKHSRRAPGELATRLGRLGVELHRCGSGDRGLGFRRRSEDHLEGFGGGVVDGRGRVWASGEGVSERRARHEDVGVGRVLPRTHKS